MNWPLVTLGDLAESPGISYGIVQPGLDTPHGVPIVRVADLQAGDLRNLKPNLRVAPEIGEKYSRTRLCGGEILVSLVGSVGLAAVVPSELAGWNVARAVAVMRPRGVEATWVTYALRLPAVVSQISAALNTTVQATLNLKDLRTVLVPLPSSSVRERILGVLGVLDGKIGSNAAIVASSSQLIEAACGASWDDRVVLAQIADLRKGSANPGEMGRVAHFSLPAFDEDGLPEFTLGESILSNKQPLRNPCVLLSKLNPRIPRIWDIPVLPQRPALASTEFLVLEPKEVPTGVLWGLLTQSDVQRELEGLARGTTGSHQRVKPDDAMKLSVPDPAALGDQTIALVDALSKRIWQAKLESRNLAALRDTLLPALMSGRLSVRDAEAAVSEVV